MFVRIFSSRRVPIYCVNLVLVSSNDPFVMLGPLSVFFVILVIAFTCYFLAIKMININHIVYSSIERLQRKRQLQARMLMLSFYSSTVCISFKAKCILPQWQVKQSNLWKCISWKRKRLEIINKIDAKRASSATRESNVNTLCWSV